MLPVVHLIREIINRLVKWFTERRELALNCTTKLCPNFGEKKLWNRLDDSARMNVIKLNNVQFNVVDGDMDGLVDLTNNSCSCRKFQLKQLPCKHVVAVCHFLKLNVYSKASRCSKSSCATSYGKGHARQTKNSLARRGHHYKKVLKVQFHGPQ
ncbi:unnamed protein product [Prunus armeniaca]